MSLTVIKLGSSVVADDAGELRKDSLSQLAATLAAGRGAGDHFVLVSSGAIAIGVSALGLPKRPQAIDELQAASAVGQGRLFRHWDDMLAAHQILGAQVLLTMHDLGEREAFVNARRTLSRLLEMGAIPIINENDTTTTEEISFGDNDLLAAQVAMMLGADKLVLLTSTDGLFTSDPTQDENAQLVSVIANAEEEISKLDVGLSTSTHGTGGMRSKALAAEMAAAAGIETVMASGLRPEALKRVLAGEAEGTRFAAGESRWSSFDLWLRYAKPASGTITVDSGAANALMQRGTSLLAVGVKQVEGEFVAGDAVEIRDEHGPLARGLSGYSAADLNKVKGWRSEQVKQELPALPGEVVHRDRLVLI